MCRVLAGSVEMDAAPSPAYVADFLATRDGLSLTKAFMRIPDAWMSVHCSAARAKARGKVTWIATTEARRRSSGGVPPVNDLLVADFM
jgi:hypothetical protein